ncbi:MAG TPA: TRAP transporter fused permease subunit [Alphaproteobacteria bacterium]
MTEPREAAPSAAPRGALRVVEHALAAVLALAALAWALDLYRKVGLVFLAEQLLAASLGFALALVYLRYPAKRGSERGRLPWYDAVLGLAGFAAGWYVAFRFPYFSENLYLVPLDGVVVSAILYALCVEGLRRTVGNALVVIVLVFSVYALIGHLFGGALQTREVNPHRLIIYLGLDASALLGLVMLVGITVVIPFILFGQLLLHSGGANFFNDVSLALMGRYRGGAAKISVVASGMFGSISGIVVSNILATGIVTIPLMKKTGYPPHLAAAVEATASTGGQLMPPVMGVVAFVMADFLQIPYGAVVIAALVPSLLYYIALFIQADLEAARLGIKRVDESQIPRVWGVLATGWMFVLPFAVLIWALFSLNKEAEEAAMYAAGTVLALGVALGYRGRRMPIRMLWQAIIETGNSTVDIVMISAAAGFIIGILQITGLGFALTVFLVKLGGSSVIALLVISAVLCIILGMGMPTLAVYVILAALVAPSLVDFGITPLAAHMFILYLGMMSFVTPPVAIGAYFAASMAGAEPLRTGFTATRFGWTAYIVPFLFVFSPSLLLQSKSVIDTAIAIATAIAGIWLVSAGMIGFVLRPLSLIVRAVLLVTGLALLVPHEIAAWAFWANVVAAPVAALVVAVELLSARRARAIMAPRVA